MHEKRAQSISGMCFAWNKEKEKKSMAKDKKLVEAITSMEDDFAQWYTECGKESGADRLHKCKRVYGDQTCRICNLGEYPA